MAVAAKRMKTSEDTGGMEIRMIDIDGQMLRVGIKEGPKGKRPLLMFNGIGANLELAIPFMKELKGRGAIIFDVPGVGGSPMPVLPYRPSTLVRMAKRLCQQLGHDEVDVSGVSWGGGIAQQFAKQYPKMAKKLVLVATSAGWVMVPGNPKVLAKMANIKRYTNKGYMRGIAAEIYGGDFRKDPTLINQHAKAMKPSSNAGYALQLLAMMGWTSVGWLWRLKQPTLIISGTDDPLISIKNAKLLHKLIPNSKLEVVEDGHLFMVTKPKMTAKMIGDFLG